MFCLSDELINFVSPFLLQLFFLWPSLMGGSRGVRRQRAMPRAGCPSLQSTSYGSSGGPGGISLLVFTLWGLGLLRLLHKSQQKVKACHEGWQ